VIEIKGRQKRQEGVAQFKGFPLGENTSVPSSMLDPRELAECIDFKIKPGGRLETRDGIRKYSDTEIGGIKDITAVTIDGTEYDFCSDDDNNIYYLPDNTAGTGVTPTQITTSGVENTPYIIAYNNAAIISDGSYLKYCDSLTDIKIAYNADGSQYDNYSGEDDTNLTGARQGIKFTSETWTAGYTIPITQISAFVQQTTAGTATISAKLRLVSDDSILAETDYTGSVPSSAPGYIDIYFDADDVTDEMEPETDYYATLEGSNFELRCTTVASGGRAFSYSGSWSATTTKDPIMKVYPSKPPKSEFCRVSGNRLWLKDPDEPGLVKTGNYTHLDWSISIPVIDDNKSSFEVGAFEDFYGTLYVYGTQAQPYLCQLQGSTSDDFSLPMMFQRIWSTPRTLINANSDLWSGSSDGIDTLAGVQEFGDLRSFSASDPIWERLEYFDTDSFAGYNAADGQYWIWMDGYNYVSVAHTKQPIQGVDGKTRYPWSRYSLEFTPTCFKQVRGKFLIGGSDGYIYYIDPVSYKEEDVTQIYPSFKTAYIELPFKTADLLQAQFLGRSRHGSSLDMVFYINGNLATEALTHSLGMPMADDLTVGDLEDVVIQDINDASLSPLGAPLYFNININCYSVQIEIADVMNAGAPIYIDGCYLRYAAREI
jgi:hypothetical protein